jgi:type 1 glutamine amidotransferase
MRKLETLLLALLACTRVSAAEGDAANPSLKVYMISGCREYKSELSLTALKAHLEEHYNATCTLSLGKDGGKELPGTEALDGADVLLVFCRRMKLPEDQLAPIKAWCAAGRPVVGIRTASHAFQTWLAFDKEVLGGDYHGHSGNEKNIPVHIEPGAKDHPILAGITEWTRMAKHYHNPNLAKDVTVLLTRPGKTGSLPLAWARSYHKEKDGRAFYTPMGLPSDFENEIFTRLLVNAIFWTAKRPVEPRRPR